jgi:hypothetical protein
MENLFNATIPVPPEMVPQFLAWVEYLGMKAKRQSRGSDYFNVSYSDGVDLYWLGANLFGKIETSSLSQHGPDSVQKARQK